MLVPFFFLFPLLKMGALGIALGSFIFLIGACIMARTLFLWVHNVFVVTTERIIDFDQRGFFERVVSQSSFEKIQDVSFHIHGAFETLFNYGDLNIKTGWGSVDLCVPRIYRPSRAQRQLLDAQEEFMARISDHKPHKSKSTHAYGSSEESAS